MGFRYLLFHIFIHVFLVASIFFVFQLNLLNLFLILLSSAVIDIDHTPFIAKHGFVHWFKTAWKSDERRKYPLHNFQAIILSLFGSFLIFYPELFGLGICSLSTALHLLWDFLEDIIILKVGTEHWR